MRKIWILTVVFVLLLGLPATSVMAGGADKGLDNPGGIPLYVIIEVTWDGTLTDADNDGNTDTSTWAVWGSKWAPVLGTGTILASATDCFDMGYYNFTFHGKTVHFDEVYVPTVDADPQVRHVVLQDEDADGTYTGSLTAEHYTLDPAAILYIDRIDYSITFDGSGIVTNFYYLEYEHKKMAP